MLTPLKKSKLLNLGGIYYCAANITTSGRPSKLIRSFAQLLLHLLHHPQVQPCPYDPTSNWWGASDASAHPDGRTYIGGWLADKENHSKEDTWWFHYQVPWSRAHKRGSHSSNFCSGDVWHSDPYSFPPDQGRQGTPPNPSEPHLRQLSQFFWTLEPKDQTDAHLCLPDAAHCDAPSGRGATGPFTHEERLQPVG